MDFPISAICVRNGKISGAWRHLIDAMKIFKDVGMTKQGGNWHVFVREGGKIGTFGQNIYPWRRGDSLKAREGMQRLRRVKKIG